MTTYKIICSDNAEFDLDLKAVNYIGLLRDMLNLTSDSAAPLASSTTPTPLPLVSGLIMKKILEFVDHHKNDPPLPANYEIAIREQEHLDAWDEEFLKVDQVTLYEILSAANYLNIKTLLNISCKKIAGMIRGKSVDELRAYFGALDDLTDEEKAAIEKENELLISGSM